MGALGLRTGRWKVLKNGQMALLDAEFASRVAPYPEIMACLLARAVRRSRYLAVSMAIIHQPRIDVRLHMLLWQLAARWGQVHRDGVHLSVRLTHSTLAELVAARRPTVTKALGELAERSLVTWTGEHWLLSETPPAELEALGSVPEVGASES
jgi:CRP-like cAMP-binding protein